MKSFCANRRFIGCLTGWEFNFQHPTRTIVSAYPLIRGGKCRTSLPERSIEAVFLPLIKGETTAKLREGVLEKRLIFCYLWNIIAPVVQWIECEIADLATQVRFLAGAHDRKIQTALYFSIHVLAGGMFFEHKKQPRRGRENFVLTKTKLFVTTN